jgi:two-component system, cell cycle sensor histidine kinase and response regulator CckA
VSLSEAGKRPKKLKNTGEIRAALRNSEEQHRSLLENLSIGVYRCSGEVDGLFMEANQALASMLGYDSVDELFSIKLSSIFPSSYDCQRFLDQLVENADSFDHRSVLLVRKDGSRINVSLTARGIRGSGGELEYVDGTVEDLSERQAMREALWHSEERFRRLIDQIPNMAVQGFGPDGIINFWNQASEDLYGYTAEEALGADMVALVVPPEMQEKSRQVIVEAASSGKLPLPGEQILLGKDGAPVPVFCSHALMQYPDSPAEIYCVNIDLRQQKAVEEEKALLEKRLRMGEKFQAIGELAGGVAHDFNNQLAAIMGGAEILKKKMQEKQLVEFVDMILRASRNAADLTEQLLAFSRRGMYRNEIVDVPTLIAQVISLLEHSVDKRIKVHVAESPSSGLLNVSGDAGQLENAFLNMGLNARDALLSGGTMTFSVGQVLISQDYCDQLPYEMQAGSFVKVTLSDDGTGMSEEVMGHIFEPFFTTKSVGEGTGMGLAAVYGTVKNHGGFIEVESQPGQGTVFTILLPAVEEQILASDGDSEDAVVSEASARVLLVEDEELVRMVVENMLTELGYQVTSVANGSEAIAYYRKNWKNVDLVLIDMVMPELDGSQSFAVLREINPAVKVVLASGYSMNAEVSVLLKQGAKAFLQKPFGIREMSVTLEKVLGNKQIG